MPVDRGWARWSGRWANRAQVCRVLGLPEEASRSPEDDLLLGLRRWGLDLPARLAGPFAFVL